MKERKTAGKVRLFITKNLDFQAAHQLSPTHDAELYIYKLKKK